MLLKLLKYNIKNIARSKWLFGYTLLFFVLTESLFRISGTTSKVHISVMNIMLITIPLVSIMFSAMHTYSSREFTELLLSQPIRRSSIFHSSFFSIILCLAGAFVLGAGVPLLFHSVGDTTALIHSLVLLLNGILITIIYTGFAMVITTAIEDKARGFGYILMIWFATALLYDALLLLLLFVFRDYPTDYPALVASFLNPLDLARITLTLLLDQSALMGYTGALYRALYGSATGIAMSIIGLVIWCCIPFITARKIFLKKDF